MDATVGSRYAESLFELAKENNQVDEYFNDICLIDEVLESDSSFVRFFSHVGIHDDVKIKLIDESFKGKVQPYVLNFLKLLIKKRRISYIEDIVKAYRNLTNKFKGIEEGIIFSRFDLDDQEVRDIEQAISKKENKTVKLRVKKDETIVGGIKVQIENRVYDDSIKNKVETLKKELLRK